MNPDPQIPLLDPASVRPALQIGQRSRSANAVRGIVIVGLGLTTGILSAVVLFLLEVYLFSFHSFMFVFVVPLGACFLESRLAVDIW
jgi:hypothetical protein